MALVHRCARIEAGETIVVEAAAGGTGTLAVQIAKRAGAKVIGLASSEEKRELVEGLGADAAVDSRAEDLGAAIREANGGERVDAVLHMSGGDAFDAEMACWRRSGGWSSSGSPRASSARSPPAPCCAARSRSSASGCCTCSPAASWRSPMIGELARRGRRRRAASDRRRRLPSLRGGAGARGPDRPPHQRQAPPRPLYIDEHSLQRPRPLARRSSRRSTSSASRSRRRSRSRRSRSCSAATT